MPRAMHGGDGNGRRRCAHVPASANIEPLSSECPQCREHGEGWVELWLCLSCGWVACSDNSPNQHAKAHYEETDHPVAGPLREDTRSRWCYVHARAV